MYRRTEKAHRTGPEASMQTSSIVRPPTHRAILLFLFLTALVALVAGVSTASGQGSPPDTPDRPTGNAVFIGGVDLEWNEVPGADYYDVQLFRNGQWIDLPGDSVEIAFYGAGAIISGLDPSATLWFRVRAKNAHGASEWSAFYSMASTNQFAKGRQPRQANEPTSGAVVINGTAQVGENLTADTTGIEDGNGLDRVQFRFQWVSNDGSVDTDISGGTDSIYNLAAADEGNTIKVRVNFTDRGGFTESLTSVATASVVVSEGEGASGQGSSQNSPATGTPTISGTAQVGETLTADTSGIADADGLTNVSYSYQWVANDGNSDTDIADATDSSYVLVSDNEGKTIKVRVSFTDDAGNAESQTSAATETVSLAVQQQIANSPATGAPTITGSAQEGETLTATTSGIADADGLTNVSYSYQWIKNDWSSDRDIAGATDSTYTLPRGIHGKTIKVKVTFTDDEGNDESLTSSATGAVTVAPRSYITVVVTADESFIVTWSDVHDCSTDYNAYLNVNPDTQPGQEKPGSRIYLGSAAFDGSQITKGPTNVPGSPGYSVVLYCGNDESGRVVSVVHFPILEGTHSSEPPLSDLSFNLGTMYPTFNTHGNYYYVPDVANAYTRITISATPKEGYAVKLFEFSGGFVTGIKTENSRDGSSCGQTVLSDDLGLLFELSDVDTNTPGFQIDLYDGENSILIMVDPTAYCRFGKGYVATIIRAEGSVSLTRPNRPAHGLPIISNRPPYPGTTMTALTSRIGDRDGMTNATLSYQWLADDSEITGATGSSYVVATTDLGKTIKVRVSFTDDKGGEESITSDATEIVRPYDFRPTGDPVIVGTLEVGQTLSADVSGISDQNGLTNATFSYQWYRYSSAPDGWSPGMRIPNATGSTYTLVDADEGKTIQVKVNFTDDAGYEYQRYASYLGTVEPRSDSRATGAPTISGTVQVGETLTADTSGIADADGLTNVSYSYQWIANDGTADTDITGATDSTYTLVADDEGKTIKVRVSFTDDDGYAESLTSDATEAVSLAVQQQLANTPATGAPSVSGTAQVGETLRAYTHAIADADGLTNVSYSYQWISNDGTSDADIAGATDSTYTLVAADEGKTIKVKVTFTDDADNEETLTSAATPPVLPEGEGASGQGSTGNSPIIIIGTPTISGTVQVGETLTANHSMGITDADGLNSWILSYQWFANDGTADTEIVGATDSTYTLVADDEGKTIKVRVSLTSEATATVGPAIQQQIANSPATGAPTISGTAQVGETLTADTSGIADADGLTNVAFSYQWIANDGTSDTDIAGATASSYTLVTADEGKTIKLRVSFTDDDANDESLTSAATVTVDAAPNSPATGVPSISGTAQVGETLTADTSGIADADGLTNVTFSYQWIANDGTSDTDIAGATASSYTLVTADEGKTIKLRVSFTDDDANDESLTSAATVTVDAAPNSPATGVPSISGTAQVGETLTADTSGIADADGLTNVTFSYQWIANDGTSDADITGATDSSYTLATADEGKTIKVRVSFTDDAGHGETLTSAATATVDAATLPPLTVSLENIPATHNGTDVFTFEIRFSEEFSLSYTTLKLHAFTVTGGTVKNAQRANRPSNILWRITVQPDANGNVTIILPVTDDCDDQGAICAGDGRKLSNGLEFTVVGPDG